MWRTVWGTGVFSIMILLALSIARLELGSPKISDEAEATWNARKIGVSMYEFARKYGTFPDDSTIGAVKAKTGTVLSLGDKTSNDYFRQLIATGDSRDEKMFYAKRDGSKRPDNDFKGKRALEKGEVGFAYIVGLPIHGNPSRPMAMAPIIPGTDRFDPKIFDGMAVILRLDLSVTTALIDKNGHAVSNGNLLDPKHPIWGGEKWKLVWPE